MASKNAMDGKHRGQARATSQSNKPERQARSTSQRSTPEQQNKAKQKNLKPIPPKTTPPQQPNKTPNNKNLINKPISLPNTPLRRLKKPKKLNPDNPNLNHRNNHRQPPKIRRPKIQRPRKPQMNHPPKIPIHMCTHRVPISGIKH